MTNVALRACRKQIDRTDMKIIALLAQRAELALQAGQTKRANGLPVVDVEREREILDRISRLSAGPLSQDSVERIYRAILRESHILQRQHVDESTVSATSKQRDLSVSPVEVSKLEPAIQPPMDPDPMRTAAGTETDQLRLAGRQARAGSTSVRIGGIVIGDGSAVVIAGPCSVESREQLFTTARAVKAAGASILRGGAYKPRTSPYDFQGLGAEALCLLRQASHETGLPVVTEVMSTDDADLVAEYVDMLQVGARSMQNFPLLRKLSKMSRPVLLKRGPSATVREWLLAAEYILAGGNEQVVLCERGICSFSSETRNTFDVAGIALAKELSHLPVIADPSHATGRRSLVPLVSRAALAGGADGIIVEVHPCPDRALSDGPQSLDLEGFREMMVCLSEPVRTVGFPR